MHIFMPSDYDKIYSNHTTVDFYLHFLYFNFFLLEMAKQKKRVCAMKPAFLCTWHEWHDLNNIFCFCEVANFVTIKFNWSAGQVLLVDFLPNQSLKQNIFHFKILEPIVPGHHLSLQFHLYQIIIDLVQFTSIYIASVIIMTVCRF